MSALASDELFMTLVVHALTLGWKAFFSRASQPYSLLISVKSTLEPLGASMPTGRMLGGAKRDAKEGSFMTLEQC